MSLTSPPVGQREDEHLECFSSIDQEKKITFLCIFHYSCVAVA